MGLIKRIRKQTAIYWQPVLGGTDQFGQDRYEKPVEIRCRWEGEQREFLDITGTRKISVATVFVDYDDDRIKTGGKMRLGTLEDIGDSLDPLPTDEEIKRIMDVPDIRAKETLRMLVL